MTNSKRKASHTHIHIICKMGGMGYFNLAARLETLNMELVFTKYQITVL